MKRQTSHLTLAVDMDGVLADLMTPWVDRLNEKEGEQLRVEDLTDWEIINFVTCGEKAFEHLDYDLFRHLPVIRDSQTVLQELSELYRVYIVTTATKKKETMVAKWEWLNEHFPFIETDRIVMCGKKDIIHTNTMIDDGPHNLETFQGPCKMLFDATYNRKEDRFLRAKDWQHIHKMLLGN